MIPLSKTTNIRAAWLGTLKIGLLLFHFVGHCQDLPYARGIVETLAMPYFHGRGYVAKGDSLAAEFIAKEYKTIGLVPLGQSFFQHFSFPVNTFPGKMEVKIGHKRLQAGKEYILEADSRGLKGSFSIFQLDSTIFSNPSEYHFPKNKKKLALAYPSSWVKKVAKLSDSIKKEIESFPVIIKIAPKKLTFSVARSEGTQCIVEVLASHFPSKSAKIKIDIENYFVPKHTARNVLGYIEGSSKKDSFLLISAHYDHLGRLGKSTYFPGANDNASGIAMLLELAKHFSKPENKLPYSLLFVAFAGEEAGLVGSHFFVENPIIPLSNLKFVLNLDLMGSGKEGLTVVNGSVFPTHFALLDSLNKSHEWFPKIVARGKAANSDHYYFSEKGIPAFFIYTLGEITAYHDVDDTAAVVTFSKFKEAFTLISSFLTSL